MAAYSPWPGLSATSTSEEPAVNGDALMYSRSPVKLGVMAASPFSTPPAGQFLKALQRSCRHERTFLAWVHTSIAVMAFGFVIERFDLFLRYAAPPGAQQQIAPHGGVFADLAGLAFIVLGIAIIAIAGWRFVRTGKDIDREDEVASPGDRFDLMLASMIGFLGAALFPYLAHTVFPEL